MPVKKIGSKNNVKIKKATIDEYKHIEKGLPHGITAKDGDKFIDTRKYIADISKAKKLGYNPKFSLDEGIPIVMDWLKSSLNI